MARNKYDIDETLERKLDFGKLKRALVYVKPNKWMMLLALSLSVVIAICYIILKKHFAAERKKDERNYILCRR